MNIDEANARVAALLADDGPYRLSEVDKDAIRSIQTELEDYDRSFELRYAADMRAIKRWQEAHPGKERVWPDHADLCVWLLEQLPEKS